VAGRMLAAVGFSSVPLWLCFAASLIPAQFFIVTRQPQTAELLGAVAGTIGYAVWGRSRRAGKILGWAFLILLLVRGFAPFRFEGPGQKFSWVPWGGFLGMEWEPGVNVLLEKTFYYGTAIWLFRAGGMRLRESTALVAITLAVIEAAQTRLPGRTSEITDPLLALLLGFGLYVLRPRD